MSEQTGTFYAVSVGPGDPELLTMQAVRTLERCAVIAAPQTASGHMLALDIARAAVDLRGKKILPLAFSCRVQSLLTALKSLRLPFCLYLPAAVMIRFIPTFLHDAKQVSETLRIRGWRMTPWNAFRHPVLLIRLVFTPLLFRSLKPSEELGIAAELKGLGYGEGMRPYRKLVWKASDTWLLVAACLVAAAAVLCQHAVGWAPLEGGMR